MYINLKDSIIKKYSINAVTKTVIPATNFTPKYFAMCVYIGNVEPIVHTYETEEERDSVFNGVVDALNATAPDVIENAN